jgi:predicted aspartyl protease
MHLARWLPGLLLLALLSACAAPKDDFDFTTCGVRPRAVLPVHIRNGVPLVDATIKDEPATFVLDTGSVGIVLTEAALKRLDLTTDATHIVSGVGVGGTSRSFVGNLRELRIGNLPVPDHEVQVLPNTSAIAGEGFVDGLFGASVLSVFEIDLDLPQGRVTLYAGRLCPSTVVPPWKFPYSTIDASQSTHRRFLIPVTLNGRRLTALLDTGSARTIVAKGVAADLGVDMAALEQGPHMTMVGTGPDRPLGYFYRFHDIRFGDQTFLAPLLVVADRPESGIDMIVGEDFLDTHRLWLSYARKRVFIEKSPTPILPP